MGYMGFASSFRKESLANAENCRSFGTSKILKH